MEVFCFLFFWLKFQGALYFVKMKTVLLTFWVFIIISLSLYHSFIIMRQYREDCELAENSMRLLCLILPLGAHGPAPCPGLRHLYTLAWAFSSPRGTLTPSPPVPIAIPRSWAQTFSWCFSWFLCHVPSCAYEFACHEPTSLSPEVRVYLLSTLLPAPSPCWGKECNRLSSSCCSPQRYLIMSVELIGCSWCTISFYSDLRSSRKKASNFLSDD